MTEKPKKMLNKGRIPLSCWIEKACVESFEHRKYDTVKDHKRKALSMLLKHMLGMC
jgi:hypothetical protein